MVNKVATANELNERLVFERNVNLILTEKERLLEQAVELQELENARLRASLDRALKAELQLQVHHEKLKAAMVEISRDQIHGKPTAAAVLAQAALRAAGLR